MTKELDAIIIGTGQAGPFLAHRLAAAWGHSRVIALADYSVEKTFVLAVPHRFLLGQPERIAVQSAPNTPKPGDQKRRPRNCPF